MEWSDKAPETDSGDPEEPHCRPSDLQVGDYLVPFLQKEQVGLVFSKCIIARVKGQQSLFAEEIMPAGSNCLILYLT